MSINWSRENQEWVELVAGLWTEGLTQEQIADKLESTVWKVRYRLSKLGVLYGRAGRLIWAASGEPLELPLAA